MISRRFCRSFWIWCMFISRILHAHPSTWALDQWLVCAKWLVTAFLSNLLLNLLNWTFITNSRKVLRSYWWMSPNDTLINVWEHSVCPQSASKNCACCYPQDLLCYLIDDGGFLVMSNQRDHWKKASWPRWWSQLRLLRSIRALQRIIVLLTVGLPFS